MAKQNSTRTSLATRQNGMQTESKPVAISAGHLAEYSALRYDYGLVSAKHRRAVQDAAVDIRRKQRRMLEDMLAIGRRLMEVKDLLPPGGFERWVKDEFDLSIRTVYNMMTAAQVYSDEKRVQRVAPLSDRAVYMLAAPSTPEEARLEVERIIEETGKVPTSDSVQLIIDEAKAKRVSLLSDEIKEKLSTPPPAPRMIEMQAATPITPLPAPLPEPPPPTVPIAFLEGAEYAEATQTMAPPEPTMPADLAAAGYQLDSNSRGLWRWELDKTWGGFRGNWTDDPGDAIEEARADFGERCAGTPAPTVIVAPYAILVDPPTEEELAAITEVEAEREEEDAERLARDIAAARRMTERIEIKMTFDSWLAAMPTDLGLRECAAILELAKTTAKRALDIHQIERPGEPTQALYNAVYGALPTWSNLIRALEKLLKRE